MAKTLLGELITLFLGQTENGGNISDLDFHPIGQGDLLHPFTIEFDAIGRVVIRDDQSALEPLNGCVDFGDGSVGDFDIIFTTSSSLVSAIPRSISKLPSQEASRSSKLSKIPLWATGFNR